MKVSKRIFISVGLGAILSCSSVLGIGTLANADEASSNSEGGTSSVSTAPTPTPSIPTTPAPSQEAQSIPTTTMESTAVTVGTDQSTASNQPTENTDVGQSTIPTPEEKSGTSSPTETATIISTARTDTETVEVFWAMPNGGTPDNVTWPQALATNQDQCGVWYQADTYLTTEAENFTSDSVLNLGEDYQNDHQRGAISWRFVYGGDCPVIPEKPPVTTETIDDHWTSNCSGDSPNGQRIHIVTTVTHDWTYVKSANTWVPNDIVSTTQTPQEVTDCPVNTPTTPSSPTTPTTIPTPGSEALTAFTAATPTLGASTATIPPTGVLAKTGSDDVVKIALGTAIALLLIVLGTAAIVSTRRKETK